MALDDDIDRLSRQPLLGLMERDALRLLAFSAETRSFRAGDVLFSRGEPADGAYFVVSGTVALLDHDDGRPAEAVAGPDSLIGEMALFAAIERPVTAVIREPARLMRLSRAVMRRVLGESPASAQALAEAVAARLQGLSGELSGVRASLAAIDRR